jgi:hypothetical protein
MRGDKPFFFTNLKTGEGLEKVKEFICREGLLDHDRNSATGIRRPDFDGLVFVKSGIRHRFWQEIHDQYIWTSADAHPILN